MKLRNRRPSPSGKLNSNWRRPNTAWGCRMTPSVSGSYAACS